MLYFTYRIEVRKMEKIIFDLEKLAEEILIDYSDTAIMEKLGISSNYETSNRLNELRVSHDIPLRVMDLEQVDKEIQFYQRTEFIKEKEKSRQKLLQYHIDIKWLRDELEKEVSRMIEEKNK